MQARLVRGSAMTFGSFGISMLLRLGSNLILTRLLFPEAFGLMALVQVFLVGLQLFSDMGIYVSVVQNPRGDQPSFLNTAWVVEILRGFLLWFAAIAIAGPAAAFYGQPELQLLLVVAGFTAVLNGFKTTRMALANRNMILGRITLLELGGQTINICAMILLAWWTGSVWSLVFGGLVGEAIKSGLSHIVIPGERNRLEWDKSAFSEMFSFGKFIFLSSIIGFLLNNGDRAILGKFVSLAELAVYNIGYMLAAVPLMLSQRFSDRILTPLYSTGHRRADPEIDAKIRKARALLTVGMLFMALCLGIVGDELVRILYTKPYHFAGPILTALSIAIMPVIALAYYKSVYIGAGTSKRFTVQLAATALVQLSLLYVGVSTFGVVGAIFAPAVAVIVIYPLTAWLAKPIGGWDPYHDLGFFVLICAAAALILWVQQDAVAELKAAIG